MGSTTGAIDRRVLRQVAGRRWIAIGVALGLVSAAAIAIQALALAHLLAAAMRSTVVDALPALGWLAGAVAIRALCALLGELVATRASEASKAGLRRALLTAVLTPGRSIAPGEAATLAGRGLDALDPYIARCLPDVVLAAAVPMVLTAVIACLDWLSAVVVGAVLLLFPLFGYLVGASTGEISARRWRQIERLGMQIADVFEGLPTLKALGLSGRQRGRIRSAAEALNTATLSALRVAFLSALVLDTLASVSVALVAVPLGIRLLSGSVGLEVALAVLIVTPEVFVPLRRAAADIHDSAEGLAAANRVLDVVEQPPAPGREAPALEVAPGEHVVVVGANGAGKTTALLRMLDLATPGERIAYLPERPVLLAASLADNLRIADRDASDEQLLGVMRDLGLSLALDTAIGEGGRPLSAGERQRIALARVLLRRASLYVLDEPTAHLDIETEEHVLDLLESAMRGRSAVIVTHRPAARRLADRVLSLDGDRFLAIETRQAVLA